MRKMESLLQKTLKWESIGIFAGGIAHDFNYLLGIIMGNIEIAQMERCNLNNVIVSLILIARG
ncbi:MAG: hypothetical protein V2B19_14630 [Pseudomonadota bacterium]